MDAIQVARERLKIIKLLAQNGRDVAMGKVISSKDVFKSLDREVVRPCLHGHNRAKELGLCPIQ